jgi:hypothetical protein
MRIAVIGLGRMGRFYADIHVRLCCEAWADRPDLAADYQAVKRMRKDCVPGG